MHTVRQSFHVKTKHFALTQTQEIVFDFQHLYEERQTLLQFLDF